MCLWPVVFFKIVFLLMASYCFLFTLCVYWRGNKGLSKQFRVLLLKR